MCVEGVGGGGELTESIVRTAPGEDIDLTLLPMMATRAVRTSLRPTAPPAHTHPLPHSLLLSPRSPAKFSFLTCLAVPRVVPWLPPHHHHPTASTIVA